MLTIAVIVVLALFAVASVILALRGRANALFLSMVALTLLLVGVAVAKDTQQRDYLAIQEQYQKDYGTLDSNGGKIPNFDIKAQQLFPQFAGAKRGDNFRVERCISCHVPNVQAVGSDVAAQRLACDFFKYEPDASHIAKADGLKSTPAQGSFPCLTAHPKGVDANYYAKFGPQALVSDPVLGQPLTDPTSKDNKPTTITGFLPQDVDPSNPQNPSTLGLDAVGCVVCHNGNRLALTESEAHTNLIVNPEYSWSQGAALYYKYCATCHGGNGQGISGPPLSNQDRLGYYNEDYYYRCIEYGSTGFEHIDKAMPNWGSIAPDYKPAEHPDSKANKQRVLSEDEINLLIQFIRHWQSYDSTP